MATGSLLEASSGIEALELLHGLGCTDGLPVVVPTPDLVESLVLASGLPADLELGSMGPAGGAATLERITTSAVMAGCLPQHMPIVVAAIEAVLDPRFDLTEMQATTHCTAPLLIVNGPAAQVCGPLSGGYGVFGPGNRANASIGRALRLAMINIGGGRAGTSDMAVHGHPGKFTYCFAEDEASSPFEPFHVALGYSAETSTVTVIGAEAPPFGDRGQRRRRSPDANTPLELSRRLLDEPGLEQLLDPWRRRNRGSQPRPRRPASRRRLRPQAHLRRDLRASQLLPGRDRALRSRSRYPRREGNS